MLSFSKIRLWMAYPSNNKFWCDGRLVSSNNMWLFLITNLFTASTSITFLYTDVPFIVQRHGFAVPIFIGLMLTFNISVMAQAACTDPGILPRSNEDEIQYLKKVHGVSDIEDLIPKVQNVVIKGQAIEVRFCRTCKMFRTPRASHCRLCDNCVEKFDHHCPWVGNCIGRRNHKFYLLFLLSLGLLNATVLVSSIYRIILIRRETGISLVLLARQNPLSFFIIFVAFIEMCSGWGLLTYHAYLLTRNVSTNEDIKGTFSRRINPSSINPFSQQTILRNIAQVLCSSRLPSAFDFRKKLDKGNVSQPEEYGSNLSLISNNSKLEL
ncbi:hypothetical protein ACOME3_009489 [Neoechinorhynchus agilis]